MLLKDLFEADVLDDVAHQICCECMVIVRHKVIAYPLLSKYAD